MTVSITETVSTTEAVTLAALPTHLRRRDQVPHARADR